MRTPMLVGADTVAMAAMPSRAHLRTSSWLPRLDRITKPGACSCPLRAMHRLTDKQVLNAQSGALHAAGWCALDGTLLDVFEDVGRHNALDKLMGSLARSGQLQAPGFVILSSRGSHELVRKCAKLGIAAMATVSAPTSMGVRMAELTGMRLWGSCRAAQGILHSEGRGVDMEIGLDRAG